MIIYGTNSSTIGTEHLSSEQCYHCEAQGEIQLTALAKYAHIFWIPTFPIRKAVVSQCRHCRELLEEEQMPDNIRDQALRLKSSSNFPWWYYIGLALIACFVVLISISIHQDKQENTQLMLHPKVGDVYEVKIKSNQYTSWKVSHLTKDTVYFYFNQYTVNQLTGIDQIKMKRNYSEAETGISVAAIQHMFDQDEIMDIDRYHE